MKRFLFIACLLCFLYSCNTNGGGDPKVALDKFLTAMQNSDFKEAKKYVTDESQGLLTLLEKNSNETYNIYQGKTFIIKNITVDGSSAKAPVEFTGESTVTINYQLEKQAGEWKVSYNPLDLVKKIFQDNQGIDIDKDINDAIRDNDSFKVNIDSLP